MNMGINPNNELNLIDYFSYYQKNDKTICYCDRCGNNNAQIISRTKLFTIPKYLIFLINRRIGVQFNIKINFPELLNTNGMAINQTGNYLLYGVVKYFEYNYFSSGYFAAYCRSPIDNCWYFCNDDYVKPINENEKIEIQEKGVTNLLFYKLI